MPRCVYTFQINKSSKSLIIYDICCGILSNLGVGNEIYTLRQTIQQITSELEDMDVPISDLPEMVDIANLRRTNDHLVHVHDKQTELLVAYEQYSHELEDMISTLFTIQNSLKDILKQQSSLIPDPKKRSRKR